MVFMSLAILKIDIKSLPASKTRGIPHVWPRFETEKKSFLNSTVAEAGLTDSQTFIDTKLKSYFKKPEPKKHIS